MQLGGSASPAIPGTGGSALMSFTPKGPSPAPTAVPTLGEWAMILMASLMAMFGIRRMRRQ
jgi:hypothetical protein